MSARTLYLVAYDISNARRLRRVFKTMRGYGDPLQYSVFQCALTATEKQLLINDLTDIIHPMGDRILIVNMGPVDGRGRDAVEILGSQSVPVHGEPLIL